jgi:diguanylate cyclase (GGDEF)-like protein/PAS domain S-box-containing protein
MFSALKSVVLAPVSRGEAVLPSAGSGVSIEEDTRGFAGLLRESLPGLQGVDLARVFGTLAGNLQGMIFRRDIDAHWSLCFVSAGSLSLTGYSPTELINERAITLEQMIEPDDRRRVRSVVELARFQGGRYRVEYRIRRKDNHVIWVQERGCFVPDEYGRMVIEGFIEDVSESLDIILRLEEAELRYRSIFENSEVGMYQTSEAGHYLAANAALARLYGYDSPASLISGLSDIGARLYVDPARRAQFKSLIEADGAVRDFESEVLKRDGHRIWISENAHAVHAADGCFLYYEGTVEDVTERRSYQRQLEQQASRDVLTGLPNRSLLQRRLEQSISRAHRAHEQFALLFVDLDNFKIINDSLGHAAGDQLIIEMGERLRACVRDFDTVARYGGDEFVLIIEGYSSEEDSVATLKRIQRSVARPFALVGHSLQVSCSIGVALYPAHGQDHDTLLRHADAAMYEAKGARKGSYRFYSANLQQSAHERLTLDIALRGALEGGEISVAYQPKVDAIGRPCGCEALMRWNSPKLGSVPPDQFIALAEELGLLIPLSGFVLEKACCDMMAWLAAGFDIGKIAVNLSASQFREAGLIEQVSAALAASGLPGRYLEVEITESVLMADVDRAVACLGALKDMGISVALDDFGTGYSSLAYLRRLPVDSLKIDRSFVAACDREADARAIARAIISLGHSLGKEVVAEGVETLSQYRLLASAGCNEFQGYLFARPMPAAAIGDWLRAHL